MPLLKTFKRSSTAGSKILKLLDPDPQFYTSWLRSQFSWLPPFSLRYRCAAALLSAAPEVCQACSPAYLSTCCYLLLGNTRFPHLLSPPLGWVSQALRDDLDAVPLSLFNLSWLQHPICVLMVTCHWYGHYLHHDIFHTWAATCLDQGPGFIQYRILYPI